jgi:CO dehydrogenase maturation factor
VTQTIAITGKGGVGKTTVSALLIRDLIRGGARPVLAIDGDPNNTLGAALGVESERVLADLRDEVKNNTPEGVSKPQYAAQQFQECIEEAEGFDLVTMGRPEGPGCYCYVNNLLRDAIHRLRDNYHTVVIDNAAGMEHISRLVTDDIDVMIIVCEPTVISVVTAARICTLTDKLPCRVGRTHLVINRVPEAGLPPQVTSKREELGLPEPLLLPLCPDVIETWNSGAGLLGEHPGLPNVEPLLAASDL